MEILITAVHIVVALFMILVVLVQGGNQGGISAAFGGGNAQGVFGATGATSFLGKLTYGAAFVFMATSLSLVILQGRGGDVGLGERLKAQSALDSKTKPEAAPASPAAPAAPSSGSSEGQQKTNP